MNQSQAAQANRISIQPESSRLADDAATATETPAILMAISLYSGAMPSTKHSPALSHNSPLTEPIPECPICLHELSGKTVTLSCIGRHQFHQLCIDDWLKRNNTCPIDREETTYEGQTFSSPSTSATPHVEINTTSIYVGQIPL